MKYLFVLFLIAMIAGAVLPVQAALNAKMGKAIGDPVYAALISFALGTLALGVYVLIARTDLSRIAEAGSVHWSVWAAGVLGAFYVSAVIILVPRIGVTLTFGLVIAGQLGLSLVLDHYGLIGLPVHVINWKRLIGVMIVIAGVLMIRSN